MSHESYATTLVGWALVAALGVSPGLRPALAQCESTKLLASDGQKGDIFGISLALDGDLALIGAHGDNDRSGSAYVFKFDNSRWVEQQRLFAADPHPNTLFGTSVAIDGDVALMGAAWDGPKGTLSGSAYVFRFNGSRWEEEQKLFASDGFAFEFFGHAVDLWGQTAVIGVDHDGDNGNGRDSGSVYVYRYSGAQWEETDKLIASDGSPFDWFGFSVAIFDQVAVIGARQDGDNGKDSGSAYVFRFNGSNWVEEQKLLPSDGAQGDRFGQAVAVYGDTAVIGATLTDDNGKNSGSAYVFHFNGSRWVEEQKLLAFDGGKKDWLGVSVELDGDTALVGAFLLDDSGAAYVFRRAEDRWIETAKLTLPDIEEGDLLGFAVAIDDETVLLGAHGDDDNGESAGAAYLLDLGGGPCSHRERLRLRCKHRPNHPTDRLIAKLKRAAPGKTITFRVDDDPRTDKRVQLNCDDGRWKGKLLNVQPGPHTVELLQCGLKIETDCP